MVNKTSVSVDAPLSGGIYRKLTFLHYCVAVRVSVDLNLQNTTSCFLKNATFEVKKDSVMY